jgi:hypothetical protein
MMDRVWLTVEAAQPGFAGGVRRRVAETSTRNCDRCTDQTSAAAAELRRGSEGMSARAVGTFTDHLDFDTWLTLDARRGTGVVQMGEELWSLLQPSPPSYGAGSGSGKSHGSALGGTERGGRLRSATDGRESFRPRG